MCDLLEFVTAKGGRFVDDQAVHATLSDPPTIEAIRWVRDQVIGGIAPRSVLTYQEPESLALFLQGLAVFHRNWPYAWDVSNDERQLRVAGKVGIAPLPGFGEGAGRSALGGWLYGISSYSRHADAAWKFVEFMTSEETQRHFALRASLAPTRNQLDQLQEELNSLKIPTALVMGEQPGTGDILAPQLGTANTIDTGNTRMNSVVYRNGSLWATHPVFYPAAAPTRSAVQVWELDATNFSVKQLITIDDATGQNFHAFPSLAVNKNNDVLVGYNRFSASSFASAFAITFPATSVSRSLRLL